MPYALIDYSKTLSMSKDHLAFCHSSTELFKERFNPYNSGFFSRSQMRTFGNLMLMRQRLIDAFSLLVGNVLILLLAQEN